MLLAMKQKVAAMTSATSRFISLSSESMPTMPLSSCVDMP